MDNMKELEKRWYFYKAKQSLVFLNSFALVGMLSLGSYYTYIKADVIKSLFNEKVLIAQAETKVPEVVVEPVFEEPIKVAIPIDKKIEEEIKTIESSKVVIASKNEGIRNSYLHEVSLEPVIPIIDMEKESRKSSSTRTYKAPTHNKTTQSKMVKAKASTYLTASELSTIKHEIRAKNAVTSRNTENIKKINLNGSSANYIETMKKKFSMSKNPREALLLAKAFYAKKEYSKSEAWALTANKLDSNKDESWHIFAKSKAKLGQRDEAIKILLSYYKRSHSPKTKALIVKIKTGRL